MIKKKFKITDMHCTSCAISIDFDLEDLEGVKSAKTSYAASVCEIEFDTNKLDDQKILENIKKSGYTAIPLE
ncbi:heavy-metal-associated domain-containing protein [Candidatus Daviesbacteria bacterium]|nr:heavy-metal-associated domain-containing protein [Candidatus Daviesbacteria bacterium]